MSLFENNEYQWRETYFVVFDKAKRPTATAFEGLISGLNKGYEVRDGRADAEGAFESLTLISKDDYAAMDLTCVVHDEIPQQMEELFNEMKDIAGPDELPTVKRIPECTARLEVYHFEQMVYVGSSGPEDEPDDFMDPGSLLVVLERIAEMVDGIVVDPQSNSLM